MVFCYSPIGLNRSTCWIIVTTVFLVSSVTLYFAIDLIVSSLIYSKLTLLQSDSELYTKWVQLPIPLGLKIWIFETTNPDDIWSGKKPVLHEKGPYVFSMWREKKILEINKDQETIKYAEHNLYLFNQNQSVGSLEDKIFTLNVPTVTIAEKLGSIGANLPLKQLTGIALESIGNGLFRAHKEELMVNMTIDELLFKGQKIKILQTLETIWRPLSIIGIKFPSTGLKDNTYGLFYGKNSTFAEPVEVIGKGPKLGRVVSWRNENKLTCWPGEPCNTIRGTDGAIFSPYVDQKQVHIFIPDLCRFISFNYDMKIVFRGINGYRFVLSESTFANKYRYPINECFCPTNGFPCNTDGVTSIGPCRSGAPIYLSQPHFLSASKDFLDSIEGLKPNQSQHQSFIDIEPTTGTPLRAKVQLQINVFVRRFPFIKTMSDIRKETIYPLVWFEQSAEINEELAQELINKLIKPLSYVEMIKYGSLIVTLSLFIISLVWKFLSAKKALSVNGRRKNQSNRQPQNRTIESIDNTIDPRRRQSGEAQKLYNLQKRGSIKIHGKARTLEPFIQHR